MARFLLAWELGAHLGHAVPLAQLADALLQRGHEVHLAWRDLTPCREVLGPTFDAPRLHLWQAPLWQATLGGLPEPATYAELLFGNGYLAPERLSGCARGWRQLYETVQPALLVADHAPTALLAARGLPMLAAPFGNGFAVPPACAPMPVWRDFEQVAADRVQASEDRALDTCNRVLALLGQPPMAALCQLFETAETFLMGWPELDHGGPWRAAAPRPSWGWMPNLGRGLEPAWPPHPGPKLFAYLHRSHPSIDVVLAALRAGPWCTLLYLAGVSDDEARRASSTNLNVVTRLVNLGEALPQAALFLSHGNTGSTYAALAAGRPCVMLPQHLEQMLLARRVAAVGAGVWLWPEEIEAGLSRALHALQGSPGFGKSALALAARNGPQRHGDVLGSVVARCEALAAQAPCWPAIAGH